MMTVYGAKAPWAFLKGVIRDNRPVWFFEETGLPYNRISLDPMKGENKTDTYAKLNPFNKVPTLEHDGFVLKQSAAILHHLASTTGQLYPKNDFARTKHLEWLFYCMSDIEAHAVQIYSLPHMTEEKDRPHMDWMLKRAESLLGRALDYLEGELHGKKYLMGDEFYAADILLGCCLMCIHEHKLILDRKNISRVLASYRERPAFRRMIEINGT